MQKYLRVVVAVTLLGALNPAHAEYAEECRELANKLSHEPGTLKAGEIDLLKSCLAGLQRSLALGEKVTSSPAPVQVCPPPPPAPVCPPCAAAPVCPKQAPAAKDRAKERDPAPDLLRPQLQRF